MRSSAWLPDESQRLLLEAALGPGAEALEAWRRWRRLKTLDDADSASYQLLPLLYRNLTRLGADDPDLGRLRGLYRHTWSRNQLLMRTGAAALRELSAAGIDTIVLKGAALSVLHYRDLGVRTMHDFDLLVPRERAHDAIAALKQGGFTSHESAPRPEERVAVHHSAPLQDSSGNELDLHWYALWQSSPDDDFWTAAIPIEIADTPSLALPPTEQLLQVCAHGAVWTRAAKLRWIADAISVIRSSEGEVDWDRLSARVRARHLAPTMLDALSYLRTAFDAPVPAETIEQLRSAPVGLLERGARRASLAPLSPTRLLLMHWDRYRRLKKLDPGAPRQKHFLAQMRTLSGSETYWGLWSYAARRLLGTRR